MTLKEGVAKAAKDLDQVFPDWYTKVDPTQTEMTSLCRCVAGQIFGWWGLGMRLLLGLPLNDDLGAGLIPSDAVFRAYHGAFSNSDALDIWVEEIAQRLYPDRPAQVQQPALMEVSQ